MNFLFLILSLWFPVQPIAAHSPSIASIATDAVALEQSAPAYPNPATPATQIEQDLPAAAYPALEPSGYYIKEGGEMTARASGFGPHEQIELRRGTKVLGEAAADAAGGAEFAFTAPLLGVTFEITALGLGSGAKASRIITLAQ